MSDMTIDNINDLKVGDEVLFADRVDPCTVTEEADTPNLGNGYRSAKLEGPRGAYLWIAQEFDDPPYASDNPWKELDELRVVN